MIVKTFVTQFIRGIRLGYANGRALKKLFPSENDKVYEVKMASGKVIPVYKKTDYLESCGVCFAGCTNLGSFRKGNRFCIVIDDNFRLLSNDAQRFCLYHELGHIANGDIPSIKDYIVCLPKMIIACTTGKPFLLRNFEDEIRADEYATKFISKEKSVECLNEIQKLVGCFDIPDRVIKLGGTPINYFTYLYECSLEENKSLTKEMFSNYLHEIAATDNIRKTILDQMDNF